MTRRLLLPRFSISSACLVLFVAVALGAAGCGKQPESISVAYSPFETTTLAWIAENQQYFEQNGLVVSFHEFSTGPAALDGMLNGDADIVIGSGEFPFANRILQGKDPRVIACIARSELIRVVARRDRGISEPVDLKGKRIGTTKGTMAEFFLGRFLQLHGLTLADVDVVDLPKPEDWVNAVIQGDVDAVVTAEPYATDAAAGLGDNAVAWSAQSGQPLFALASTTDEWLDGHPTAVRSFLKSLVEAADFAVANPGQAQAIVQARLGLDPATMPAVWARNQFSITMDQSLIAAMEDETRWLIRNGLTAQTSIPDFLSAIREDALKAVSPEAVDIIQSPSR